MNEKILGYILLIVGLLLIGVSVFSVFSVFTGRQEAYQLFNFSGISLNLSKIIDQQAKNFIPQDTPLPEGFSVSSLLAQNGTDSSQELITSEMINLPMNLFAHITLMGFLAAAGLKVATIGTYLLREIKVNLKEEKSSEH